MTSEDINQQSIDTSLISENSSPQISPTNNHKRKFLLISSIILAILIIAVGSYYGWSVNKIRSDNQTLKQDNLTEENTTMITQPTQISNSSEDSSSNIISASVTDALTKSTVKGIQCNRIKENDNTPPGTVYIKDNKIKFEGGNYGLMTTYTAMGIFKDDTLWIWEPEENEGTKLLIPPGSKDINIEVIAEGFDKYKQECRFVDVEDNFFTAPTDVTFVEG